MKNMIKGYITGFKEAKTQAKSTSLTQIQPNSLTKVKPSTHYQPS